MASLIRTLASSINSPSRLTDLNCRDLQLSGKSGLGAFTNGAVGTSKVTSGKCTVSLRKVRRFESGSDQDGRVQERRIYVKLCLYLYLNLWS